MLNNDSYFSDNKYYVYNKNINFCSGYFPSFITLDCNKLNLISQDNSLKNIKDNYYLKVKDNKYLKQVVNSTGKYNYNYLNDMKEIYQICNIHKKQLGALDISLQMGDRKKKKKRREEINQDKKSST